MEVNSTNYIKKLCCHDFMGRRRAKTKSYKNKKDDKSFERKKKKYAIIIGGALAFLMVFSAFGVILYNDSYGSDNDLEIEGFRFSQEYEDELSYWEVVRTPRDKRKYIGLRYYSAPQNLYLNEGEDVLNIINNAEGVLFSLDVGNLIKTNVNLSGDSNFNEEQIKAIQSLQIQNIAIISLSEELHLNNIYSVQGLSQEYEFFEYPVITCEDATKQTPVIAFKKTAENKEEIITEDYCIKINTHDPYKFLKMIEEVKLERMLKQ